MGYSTHTRDGKGKIGIWYHQHLKDLQHRATQHLHCTRDGRRWVCTITLTGGVALGYSTHKRDGKGRDLYQHHLQELQHWATQLIQEMVREGICTITICRSCSTGQHNSNTRDGKGRDLYTSPSAGAAALGNTTHTRDGKGRDLYHHHLQELQRWATQLIQEMVREGIFTITKELQHWATQLIQEMVRERLVLVPSSCKVSATQSYSTPTRDGKERDHTHITCRGCNN